MIPPDKHQPAQKKVDYNTFYEFKNLNRPHKALVFVVSIFITLLTLGLATSFVIPSLIGRLRKLEVDEATKLAKAANKVNIVVIEKPKLGKQQIANVGDENDDEIPPEIEVELAEESEKEKLIMSFWSDRAAIDKIIKDLENVNKNKKIESHQILDKYCEFKKKNDEKFSVSVIQKTLLDGEIAKILDEKYDPDPIQFPYKFQEKNGEIKNFVTYKTIADDSCGFHVLEGIEVDGYFRCDALKARKRFCDYLQEAFDQKRLPTAISTILDDYYFNSNDAPAPKGFNDALEVRIKQRGNAQKTIDLRQYYKTKNYDKLVVDDPKSSKEFAISQKRKEDFKNDPRVFRAYLSHLRKNSTCLLQDELYVAAQCFNKRIRLFQAGWGKDRDKLQESEFFHDIENVAARQGKEVVPVYYKSKNKHYERAALLPIEEKAILSVPSSQG